MISPGGLCAENFVRLIWRVALLLASSLDEISGVRAQCATMSAPTFARGHGATLTFGAKVCGVCGLFVGFSDDRRLDVIVRFGVAVFVLGIIIVVGVSRRHRVAHEAPANQRGGNVLGYAWCHVGSCLDIATFMDGC